MQTTRKLAAILSADVVGYSRLMEEDEQATVEAITATRHVVGQHVAQCGGRVVDATGDALLADFPSAVEAVRCAVQIQRELIETNALLPENRRMLLRIGLNLGDVIEQEAALYGDGVNIAARLQALGEPAGVCVSGTIYDQVEGKLPLTFTFAGEQTVKNLAKAVRAYHVHTAPRGRTDKLLDAISPGLVVTEGSLTQAVSDVREALGESGRRVIETVPKRGYMLGVDALEPATRPSLRTNLPAEVDALIGREADIAALTQWLAEHRLVTVLGAGGIGKTRLAQAVARVLVDKHADGVWWVDLAALSAAEQIAPAIAAAAQLQLRDGDATTMLARWLAQRDMLLVLDNCEHLAGDVAALAQAILAAAPEVRLLATSQQVLGVSGERVYRLDTLAVPSPGTPLDAARNFTALQLLERRARAADRHFEVGKGTIDSAIELCRKLDGIALAIEMAAARLPALGIETVHRLVAERLLRNVNRGAPARQKTLRATLDWSHALLDERERAVLRRLSVFAGNFRLELAQRVAADDTIDEWGVLDALSALVDKSLLQVSRQMPPRYRLLETTRLYATERLNDAGETDAMLRSHGRALAALADAAVEAFDESSDAAWLRSYAGDYDDWRSAFERACERRDPDVAAATGHALGRVDDVRGVTAMFRARKTTAHALLPLAAPRAHALLWGLLAWHSGIAIAAVPRRAAVLAEVAAWRALGDRPRLYAALWNLASECAVAGEWAAADAAAIEARDLEGPAWPPRTRLLGAACANDVCSLRGELTGYRERGFAVLALAQQAGSVNGAAWARLDLADHALMAGDVDDAIALGQVAVAELRTLDLPTRLAWALANLCAAHLMAGELAPARAAAVEALPLMWQNEWGTDLLNHVALLAARTGRHMVAGRLLGFAEAAYAANQDCAQPNEARLAALAAEAIDAALGPAQQALLRAQGAKLSVVEAEALACELLAEPSGADLPATPAEEDREGPR